MKPFMGVDHKTNEYFLRYYNGNPNKVKLRIPPNKVRNYIEHCWVLSYEQCLLDLMQAGYSMCIVDPMIRAIHKRMDDEFAAYQSKCEQHNVNIIDGVV